MLRRLLGPKALGRKSRAPAMLALALALLGACGSGGTTTVQGFFLQVIGPAGGVAAAGDVHVTIPPGALAQATGVGVLLEPGTFPIVADPPDGCIYSYLGPIWCVGPVGQALLVSGVLRLSYNEALIPFGRDESQLVLLVWDNVAGVMRPVGGPDVVHDTVNNRFIFNVYPELGHIAVGLQLCVGNILLQNGNLGPMAGKPSTKPAGPGSTQGGMPEPVVTLWLVDPSEAQPPSQVDTFGLEFDSFLASPVGTRVLLRTSGFRGEGPTAGIWTVPLGTSGSAVLVAADDFDNGRFVQAYDPLFGWLAAAPTEVFFATLFQPLQPSSTTTTNEYELWRRVGDGVDPATLMYTRSADGATLEDLRQSFDTTDIMLRSFDYFFGSTSAAVFGSPTGLPIHSDGLLPGSIVWPSPQFFQGDPVLDARLGSLDPPERTYVIVGEDEVQAHAQDATYLDSLYPGGGKGGTFLRHFAMAPDTEHWAAIVLIGLFDEGGGDDKFVTGGSLGGGFELWMGSLSTGLQATYYLGFVNNANELIWHPDGQGVFADLGFADVGYYRLVDDDGVFIDRQFLPIPSLTHLDVNRIDGRILILVTEEFLNQGRLRTAGKISPGLYVSPPDASEFVLVDLGDLQEPENARWVDSWRLQPGQFSNGRVR